MLQNFFSKNSVKIWPEKKVPWQRRGALRCSRWKSHFSPKNAFFGQKMTFFWKIHFIQNSSVTKNTSFTCFKKKFTILWFSNFHLIIHQDSMLPGHKEVSKSVLGLISHFSFLHNFVTFLSCFSNSASFASILHEYKALWMLETK